MLQLKINEKYSFEIDKDSEGLNVNGAKVTADVQQLSGAAYHVINQNQSYNVEVVAFDAAAKTAEIKVNNNTYKVTAKDQFDMLLDKLGLSNLNAAKVSDVKAPMPGLVLKVFVDEGMEVKKGDNLFVLEAMKMENIIKATGDVTVKSVKIKPGDKVEKGQVLMMF